MSKPGAMNESAAPVVSNDIPTGIDATTGAVCEPAIRATATVTIALPKTGLPGADAGRLTGDPLPWGHFRSAGAVRGGAGPDCASGVRVRPDRENARPRLIRDRDQNLVLSTASPVGCSVPLAVSGVIQTRSPSSNVNSNSPAHLPSGLTLKAPTSKTWSPRVVHRW